MRQVWHPVLSESDLRRISFCVLRLSTLLKVVQDIVFPEDDAILQFCGFPHVHTAGLLNQISLPRWGMVTRKLASGYTARKYVFVDFIVYSCFFTVNE